MLRQFPKVEVSIFPFENRDSIFFSLPVFESRLSCSDLDWCCVKLNAINIVFIRFSEVKVNLIYSVKIK